MNAFKPQIHINLSMPQQSNFGRLISKLYYNDSSKLLDLAPNRDGYPHNGGEHSLRIWGDRDECVAFIQLLGETHPNVLEECSTVMAAIEAGGDRIYLVVEMRKAQFNKVLNKFTLDRGWDESHPPERYKWFFYKKFNHGVTIQATVNWNNYTINFTRLNKIAA